MVLETSWGTRGGWIVVRDVLLIGPWHHADDRSHTHRRTPTDYDADHVLLRTVRCVNGEVQLGARLRAGVRLRRRAAANWEYGGDGYHDAVARAHGSDLELRLTTDLNLGIEGPRVTARHLIKEGETCFCALSWSEHPAPRTFEEAYERLVWTAHHWQHWLDRGEFPDHPWRADLQRSRAHAQGAHLRADRRDRRRRHDVAARDAGRRAQLGLPLHAGSATRRSRSGASTRSASTGRRTTSSTSSPTSPRPSEGELQIMYGIDGRAELPEQTLDHLSGYENARPVRVGNAAHSQAQHDVWGAVLDSVYLHTKSRDSLPERVWPMLVHAGRGGDRELARARPRHLGGARRAEALHVVQADVLGRARPRRAARRAARGLGPRDARGARSPTRSTPTSASTRSTSAACSPSTTTPTALDASVLLMPLVRFLPADDERIRATVLAIADELTEDGLVLRYRVEETDDGLAGEEGTFTICSFWLVSALCEIGEIERGARPVREAARATRARSACTRRRSTPRTGRHLGNFPQAFTHLALINAVMHVIRAEEDVEARFSAFTRRPGAGGRAGAADAVPDRLGRPPAPDTAR